MTKPNTPIPGTGELKTGEMTAQEYGEMLHQFQKPEQVRLRVDHLVETIHSFMKSRSANGFRFTEISGPLKFVRLTRPEQAQWILDGVEKLDMGKGVKVSTKLDEALDELLVTW